MSKARITVREDGSVVLSKNGRAVSIATARAILSHRWPGIEWRIVLGDHKTTAIPIRDNQ